MAQIEIHTSTFRPGFDFMEIALCCDWQTVAGYQGVHVEFRGTKVWERHRVWVSRER